LRKKDYEYSSDTLIATTDQTNLIQIYMFLFNYPGFSHKHMFLFNYPGLSLDNYTITYIVVHTPGE